MAHYLITGGSGGIATALLHRLSAHTLTVVTRNPERVHGQVTAAPLTTIINADLSTEAGAETVAEALRQRPALDGAAHLLGSLLLKPAHRISLAEWRQVMAINLDSSFLLLRVLAAIPLRGSLVYCSSVAATLGLANHEAIAAAKAGIEGLVRSAAASYAAQGLRVNAVAPALTETPLTAGLIASEAARKAVTAMHPLGRLGTVDDQAAAIMWLLSPESNWVTGQVIGVDGGLGRLRTR